ncbi:MAG: ATP-binding cassette domain-containing protein, partial [Alphaproteobacteria bacterium]|nr:ATP-binding cassette domain-containing protein [Alphaproteobacteria bacterium]
QTVLMGLQTVIVIYLASRAIMAGDGFSLGMLFAFMSFRQTFSDRINALIAQAVQFRLLGLHLDRLGDIVQATPDAVDPRPLSTPPKGGLELRGVKFRYGAADRLILDGVNLVVCPGDYLAIGGPSGAGKSTLLKLLLGLHMPTEGDVLLDGLPAAPELWRAWRKHVGVVSQEDRLLSGTIADNIAFFDLELDMTRVHAAAIAARVHEDILRMPMQYLSLVGDMGSALSGGQKQRVLLARALYRDPKILFLDEGTANLDEATEAEIANLIEQLPITRIVIAHRPMLIERAQRQLWMEDGQVFERVSVGATS